MRILFQVLGTDTGDVSPSCLVVFDQEAYLFNCGEGIFYIFGLQRYQQQRTIKISQTKKKKPKQIKKKEHKDYVLNIK